MQGHVARDQFRRKKRKGLVSGAKEPPAKAAEGLPAVAALHP